MNCFVGIDIGTSTIKCMLVSSEGKILGFKKECNKYKYEGLDKIEFNAEERYERLCSLIRSVLKEKPEEAKVAALCFTGASGNVLLLDKEKKPVGNAVSWQDIRAESTYQALLSSFSEQYVHSVCGWPRVSGFPLSIFAWMKENCPDVYYSAEYYATDFVYFNHRLSGSWTMDTSTATTFYLQEQEHMKYHQPFLDFLDIKEECLPELVKSGEPVGRITRQASSETGLSEGIPVVAGAFDHPTAAIGTGMTNIGDMLISSGTSWVGFVPVKSRDMALEHQMLVDPFLSPDGPWGAMFSFTRIGVVINEYINLLFDHATDRFEKFDKAALESSLTGSGCSFDLLQTTYSQEVYLSNLLAKYGVSQISRSIMESMAKIMSEQVDRLKDIGLIINNITMAGGFAGSKVWPRILREHFGLPVNLASQGDYSGCIGAAILAGIGIGLYENVTDGFKQINAGSVAFN